MVLQRSKKESCVMFTSDVLTAFIWNLSITFECNVFFIRSASLGTYPTVQRLVESSWKRELGRVSCETLRILFQGFDLDSLFKMGYSVTGWFSCNFEGLTAPTKPWPNSSSSSYVLLHRILPQTNKSIIQYYMSRLTGSGSRQTLKKGNLLPLL